MQKSVPNEHSYPHHNGEVDADDLKTDLTDHPEAYHELLVPAIRRHLEKVSNDKELSVSDEALGSPSDEIIRQIDAGNLREAVSLVESYANLSQDVARRLIDEDCDDDLARNLSQFSVLSRDIASSLLSYGWSYQVLKYREKFESIPLEEVVEGLAMAGKVDLLIHNRDFLSLTQYEMVNRLCFWGYSESVLHRLDQLECTDELLWQLIDNGKFEVLSEIERFDGQEINSILRTVLMRGNGSRIHHLDHITGLSGLNMETAKVFVDCGYWEMLRGLHESFDIDWSQLCEYIYQTGKTSYIPILMGHASELSNDIAFKLIETHRYRPVLENLSKFPSLDRQDLANVLLKSRNGAEYIVDYIEEFSMIDKRVLVESLLEDENGLHALKKNLGKFSDIDSSAAYKLIDAGYAEEVWRKVDHFNSIDYSDLAICTMAVGQAYAMFGALRSVVDRGIGIVMSREVVLQAVEEGFIYELLENMMCLSAENAYIVIEKAIENGYADSVAARLYSMPDFVDRQKVVQLLMDARAYRHLAMHINSLPQVDESELGKRLIEGKAYDTIFARIQHFPSIRVEDLCTLTINARQYGTIVRYIEHFNDLDASLMLECAKLNSSKVVENIDRFKDVDKQVLIDYLFSCGKEQALLYNPGQFEGVDMDVVVERAINNGNEWLVAQNLHGLSNVEPWVAGQLLHQGYSNNVYNNLSSFKGLSNGEFLNVVLQSPYPTDAIYYIDQLDKIIDTAPLVMLVLKDGRIFDIIDNLEKITSVKQDDILRYAEENDLGDLVLEGIHKFTSANRTNFIRKQFEKDPTTTIKKLAEGDGWMAIDLDDPQSKIFSDYFESTPLKSMDSVVYAGLLKILSRSKASQMPKNLYEQTSRFGKYTNIHLAIAIDDLRNGIVNEDCDALGVSEKGEKGIVELQGKIRELVGRFRLDQFTEDDREILAKSRIARLLLMVIAEYDPDTSWGDRSESALERKLQYRKTADDLGVIEPLDEGYSLSQVYDIEKLDKISGSEQWSPDVLERYGLLISDLNHAQSAAGQPMGVSKLVEELRTKVDSVSVRLSRMIDLIDDSTPKADVKRRNLQKRIDALQQYIQQIDAGDVVTKRFVMNSPDDFQRGFAHFEPYEELHSAIRRLTFAWALHKNPKQRVHVGKLNTVPQTEDLAHLREFIEVIVNRDTFGDYFSDKRLAAKFRRMTSTKAFEEALLREQQRTSKSGGTTKLQFIPTRGMFLELSGQIGGACWADQHDSIAEDKPQITGMVMRARPDADSERIVGAALLIKTKEQGTDEGVLLLRGLNPKENYINKVDLASFYNAATDYVREMAAKQGLKPAIVIDDHSGGSGTNRSVLFAYLEEQRKSMQNIIVDYDSTLFNGYDVTQYSYAL